MKKHYSLGHGLTRIFSQDKLVLNRFANTLGCHVMRVVIAELLLRKRRRRLRNVLTTIENDLLRDGIAIVQDFLSEADLQLIKEELSKGEDVFFKKEPTPDKFGIARSKIPISKHPHLFPNSISCLLGSQSLLNLVRIAEGWSANDDFSNQPTRLTYELLRQVSVPASVGLEADAQISSGDLHTDTFHYVTKVFLTLNDVTIENAPYTYVPNSQRLTRERLAWEYRNSLRPEQYSLGEFHNRVLDEDQKRLNLTLKAIEVPENTMIITNTFGFHLRGTMTKLHAERRMLRLDFRSSPFRL
jgi:hypothetical protein